MKTLMGFAWRRRSERRRKYQLIESFSKGERIMKDEFPLIDKERTAKNLRRIMEERGIGVKELQLSLRMGCVQSVYRWLDGTNIPNVDNLYALSVLLEVPLDELIFGNYSSEMQSTIYNRYARYTSVA